MSVVATLLISVVVWLPRSETCPFVLVPPGKLSGRLEGALGNPVPTPWLLFFIQNWSATTTAPRALTPLAKEWHDVAKTCRSFFVGKGLAKLGQTVVEGRHLRFFRILRFES